MRYKSLCYSKDVMSQVSTISCSVQSMTDIRWVCWPVKDFCEACSRVSSLMAPQSSLLTPGQARTTSGSSEDQGARKCQIRDFGWSLCVLFRCCPSNNRFVCQFSVTGDTTAIKAEQNRRNIHTHIRIDTPTLAVWATKMAEHTPLHYFQLLLSLQFTAI